MTKLFFASLFTLGVLFSFVFAGVWMVLLYTDQVALPWLIGLTILINFFLWLLSPFFTDLINRFFYKVKFHTQEEFQKLHPELAALIDEVAKEYKFPFPKIGLIPDQNPTAFTYGSGRYNARLVLTEGIFHYLEVREQKAVVAHELGHIVNRDFIVMMVASTLVQILYEIYATLIHTGNQKRNPLKSIALLSYLFYLVGIYLLLYLSRTREYLADTFSAQRTPPQDLADALIKLGYGIMAADDDDRSKRLLQSTRHLGIVDVKNAKHLGIVSSMSHNQPDVISEVMVFDKISPWAKLIQLSSTHPLTGNRLDNLSKLSKESKQPFKFDVQAAIDRMKIDWGKLYRGFFMDLFITTVPILLFIPTLILLPITSSFAAVGVGIIIQVLYRFPQTKAIDSNLLTEMRNPYASPMRGKPVHLSGQVIGRGVPGYIFGEDVMFQDNTGLIFVNYNSWLGWLGNLFFALRRLKQYIGKSADISGWFHRGMGPYLDLNQMKTQDGTLQSHPYLWTLILAGLLIAASIFAPFLG